ncbi:(2Fe-2S) ferredoxin domain-containing protein [Legionella bononiensis]|uniref:(2Fe-2S) ferredoxin domain-containing protein n=2 Tax=Legionella bononiensis TaxID=2793102 RepID=A0ABS1W9U5_9GAMM|nr:(2Fe-2S) ferredoxin domain-containing protein [Legionella bononiensis]MBL7480666.1 (2Fe-2S) ferredoxin domain-containing protein [Legionella bononiensis]MBL7526135.1 (2Fe-2S) ferredoxin domain-containing protein [Legionella bononiensis]MBL7563370.1 (2Fe-2S) ferredoxin domain-containing protein [Legionella bononiensis]
MICTNQKAAGKQCCANTGGEEYFDYLKSRLLELDMHGPGKYRVSKSGCLGRCSSGPCIVIYPEGVWYSYTSLADIDQIIESHLIAGETAEQLLIDK